MPQVSQTISSIPNQARHEQLPWLRQRAVAIGLVLAWVGMMLISFIVLRQPGCMVAGEELSHTRAMFLSVNAATLTGFEQPIGINEFNPEDHRGQVVLFSLILLSTLFSTLIGGIALKQIWQLNYTLSQLALSAVLFQFLAMTAGAAAIIGHGRSLFDALFQSAAAYGNCGLASGTVSDIGSIATDILLILAVLGGLGLPVLMDLYDRLWGLRKLSAHSLLALRWSAIVYLIGFAGLFILRCPSFYHETGVEPGSEKKIDWPAVRSAVSSSSAQAINCRTAGLHIERIDTLPRSVQWLCMGLMIIGACSAGAGGGIKADTLPLLGRGVRSSLAGQPCSRAFGVACVGVLVYIALIGVGVLLMLSLVDEMPADQILFLVISAVSNVGLSHNPVALSPLPIYVLAVLMLLGRLVPMGLLWWLAEMYACGAGATA